MAARRSPRCILPEDVRPSEAETMILPRTPDETLVVDVARGLDSGSMIEQAHRVLTEAIVVESTVTSTSEDFRQPF